LTVPVAVTERTMGPSVTRAVTNLTPDELLPKKYQPPAMIITAISSIHTLFLMLDNPMGNAQLLTRHPSVSSD
jgi:hypothetical protein